MVDDASVDVSIVAGVIVFTVACVVFEVVRVRRVRLVLVRVDGTRLLFTSFVEDDVRVVAIVANVVVGGLLVSSVANAVVFVGFNGVVVSSNDVVNVLDAAESVQFALAASSHGGFAAL